MPARTTQMATLGVEELAALTAEITPFTGFYERYDSVAAQRIEAICERYGLTFTDSSTREPLSR
ncbi:hypothetical protein [Actinoplanes auranticolor]|nr:hypothetical protein [Actinoplanes auranticolor]